MFTKAIFCFVLMLGMFDGTIAQAASPKASLPLENWLSFQTPQSLNLMLTNISRPGSAAGSIVAAPGQVPNYYFHWVRDSSLTMDVIITLLENSQSDSDRNTYDKIVLDFIHFSMQLQATTNPSGGPYDTGLGEPRFNVDGTPNTLHWGRPQNDGAAIRASTLMRLGNSLLDEGQMQWVATHLYTSGLPARSLIKADLEFVAHHWMDPSYDIWEEILGDHFYTRMVQRRAMVEGAEFAERMGDVDASGYYQLQAQQIEQSLENFWSPSNNSIVATLNQTAGPTIKTSDLDSSAILAVLHGAIQLHTRSLNADEARFGVSDDQMIVTAQKLESVFAALYPINQTEQGTLATAIGRYAEDRYNGVAFDAAGNPWFLLTNAFAEYYYRVAAFYKTAQSISITPVVASWLESLQGSSTITVSAGETITSTDSRFEAILSLLTEKGDQFFGRTQLYSDPSGNMSEEIDRTTGTMTGAQNLTWSHASMLTAYFARQSLGF
jgi:glucoamylase